MCFPLNNVKNLDCWNWDGDYIIHNTVVPSSRPVVGSSGTDYYKIDVREFLITERNALITEELETIKLYVRKELNEPTTRFTSRKPGTFDFRAFVINCYVSEKISYDSSNGVFWQFPDETLFLKKGDCEDRALLMASLLVASGISSYNVRVALGKVRYKGTRVMEEFDHVWVMYKSEKGKWRLIEPMHLSAVNPSFTPTETTESIGEITAEYIPFYLFNDHHLWGVAGNGKVPNFEKEIKKRWSEFKPEFIGKVHQSILERALEQECAENPALGKEIKRYFSKAILGMIGEVVDVFDRPRYSYDPAMHCDNCFIDEGWNLIHQNLATFKTKKNLHYFFKAAHTIGDFYAHSSYAHFAGIKMEPDAKDDYVELYDPAKFDASIAKYDATGTFNLTSNQFTVNDEYWKGNNRNLIATEWNGKLISGRYAQKEDTWKDIKSFITEGILAHIPVKTEKDPGFKVRGWVPHHNEIAVDSDHMEDSHKLYKETKGNYNRTNRDLYQNQYNWRVNAAIRHIREAYAQYKP
jgi:hypothetical protein